MNTRAHCQPKLSLPGLMVALKPVLRSQASSPSVTSSAGSTIDEQSTTDSSTSLTGTEIVAMHRRRIICCITQQFCQHLVQILEGRNPQKPTEVDDRTDNGTFRLQADPSCESDVSRVLELSEILGFNLSGLHDDPLYWTNVFSR